MDRFSLHLFHDGRLSSSCCHCRLSWPCHLNPLLCQLVQEAVGIVRLAAQLHGLGRPGRRSAVRRWFRRLRRSVDRGGTCRRVLATSSSSSTASTHIVKLAARF